MHKENIGKHSLSINVTQRESTGHHEASSRNLTTRAPEPRSSEPILFPWIRIYFCGLPFRNVCCGPTFFFLWIAGCQPWRPDAIVDTIRVQLNFSFGFSRTVGKASDTSKDKVLDQPIKPISRQSEITEKCCQQDKTTLPGAPTYSIKFPYATARYPCLDWKILTPVPFKIQGKDFVCGTLLSFRIDQPMSNRC